METPESNIKLFKVRVTLTDDLVSQSYESISLSQRDLLTFSLALQLGYKVIIENI